MSVRSSKLPVAPVESNSVGAVGQAPARRGAKSLFGASIFAQITALLRYVILARLLGPEQLGLAATIVVTGSFFDLISETGSDRFLVQDTDGNLEQVQKLVQLVYACRGALIALALVVFSIPIATFYGTPKLAVGLVGLALSPLILGFMHLDVRRQQRGQDFRTEAITAFVSESCSLVATAVAAWLTRDFTAILYGLVTRAVIMTLMSHLRAERPYRLGYSHEHAPRLRAFAAPLMLSGLMLFIGSQGDRVIVANLLGFKALGQYSAVLLLVYYPSAVLLRYIHSISVPMIAGARHDAGRRDEVTNRLGGQTVLLAVSMAVGFAIVAPIMVPLLYGGRYAQAVLTIGVIGILQTTRFLIVWPTTVAISTGRSRTVLISNVVRMIAYPGAFLGVLLLHGLFGVVVGFVAGEVLAIFTALVLVNRDIARPLMSGMGRLLNFLLVAAAIVGWDMIAEHGSGIGVVGAMATASMMLALYIVRRESPTIRDAFVWGRRFVSRLATR